jgi:hypothetical protein
VDRATRLRVAASRRGYLVLFDRCLRARTDTDEAAAWKGMAVMCELLLEEAPGIPEYTGQVRGRPGEMNHVRWHVNRRLVNPDCEYCREEN